MFRLAPLACILAACSSTSAVGDSPPGGTEPTPSTATDWQPSDGDRLIAGFARQCLEESSWAVDFRKARGRTPVVRVDEVSSGAQDGTVLAGQLEKALLDSGQVQVAASVHALAEIQRLQNVRQLNGAATEPAAGADLSTDYVLTVQVTATSTTNREGTLRVFTGAIRVVNHETGATDCAAMTTSKKPLARED